VEVEDVVIVVEATLVVLGLTPTLVVVTIEGVTDVVLPGGISRSNAFLCRSG
jgi:hypothetical protein